MIRLRLMLSIAIAVFSPALAIAQGTTGTITGVAREEDPGRLGDRVERFRIAGRGRHVPDLPVADPARLPGSPTVTRTEDSRGGAGETFSVYP